MKANRRAAAILVLLVAACATPKPPPAPPPAPPPVVVRPAPSTPATDWRDLRQSPGDWRWSVAAGRSTAVFGEPGAAAALTLACDAATRSVVLRLSGPVAAPAAITITTTSQRRTLSGVPLAGGLAVSIPARDGILDAIAFSRGRFVVEAPGEAAVIAPSWPEISRVIEDCR